ncbi:AAA family ATPase (plasmid) [Deinococcus taeanensis]|uniref:BTAD domain-containing putative transcriptional regulator n=1 Tax=Deinococcus taeanensis TaxID=2737050 RepID=UPI001CDCECA5|nr:BTAD domain-containing putative transcriptional regulator [Deinococcus taeanensis]UBV44701.1 AAA family ATPase [Deinococcus taeanensis]
MQLCLTRAPRPGEPTAPLLLGVLALQGPVSRAALADLLWPDSPHARSNLRVELHRLKRGAFAGHVDADPDRLALCSAVQVDVHEARARALAGDFVGAVERVGAALLPWVTGSVPAEEWLGRERARWEAEYLRWLGEALSLAERQGQHAQARALAEAWLTVDPLSEDAHARALRACVLLGDASAARRAYRGCERMTRAEFGRAPRPDTRAWLSQLTDAGAAPVPAALPRLPLVGREQLFRDLLRPGAWLLLGDPGVGKTRLAVEVARQLGASLLVSGAMTGAPLAALLLTLEEVGEVAYGAAARRALAQLRREQEEPDFTPSVREALYAGLAQALQDALAGRNVLLVDDLHDLDPATLEVLGRFLHLNAQRPPAQQVKVVATARTFELQRGRAGAWVAEQRARGTLHRAEVPPLGQIDILNLVHFLSRQGQGGAQFAARLHECSGGNPLFFQEILRALLASGDLARTDGNAWLVRFDADGGYGHLAAPSSVSEAVLARAALLPGPARHCLNVLCLQTRPISAAALAGASHLSEWAVLQHTALLKASGFAHEIAGGYVLRHNLQRQALRGALSEQEAQVLHAELAAALHATGAPLQDVALCYEAGGRARQAAQAWVKVAEAARSALAPAEATRAFERALTLGLDDPQDWTVMTALYDLHVMSGGAADARGVLPRLRARVGGSLHRQAELNLREAQLHLMDAAYPDTLALTEGVLDLPEITPSLRARALHLRGMARVKVGQFDLARADLLAAREVDPLDHTRRAFEASLTLVSLAIARGAHADGLAESEHLRRVATVLGGPERLLQTEHACGTLAAVMGDETRARTHLEAAAHLAEQHHLDALGAPARANLAGLMLASSGYTRALALYEAAMPYLPPQAQPAAQANMGTALVLAGELGRGLHLLESAVATARDRGEVAVAARRQLRLTEARLRCGHLPTLEELGQLQREIVTLGLDDLHHQLTCVRVEAGLLRCGAPGEAHLDALTPNDDERERHAWVVGLGRLLAGDHQGVQDLLNEPLPSTRLAALLTAVTPGRTHPPRVTIEEEVPALDALLLAHVRASQGDPHAQLDRDARLGRLTAAWPGQGGALERLLSRIPVLPPGPAR